MPRSQCDTPLLILALVTHFHGDDHIILFYFDAMADVEIALREETG